MFKVDEDTAATAEDVARPNVAIGRSEYIADEDGIHRSHDLREGTGRAPKPPADYSNTRKQVPESPRNSGAGRAPRHDGEEYEMTDNRLSGSSRTRTGSGQDPTYLSHETYRAGADLENGNLGGNYRVSGL